ncbi:MmgE/PrpD family protein [Pseudohoeflea coraliihabitans]|uniref:MmgE/PrpD family protein n=1 Tax=Pseudohoeflea coraliihabitans TaxID=2860393 RepID=A0ABS6WJZ3_9HYPH|nr:MmgE/PrpD family protein [Pseudohoeflea sp. DP4N28-3]MBW3096266.1 MmgE/PrpD family protein [Pseudohoeflea sp. DP4N28-3]
MTVVEELSRSLVQVKTIPAEVSTKAIEAIEDLAVAAIAGIETPASEAAASAAKKIWGTGPAVCWFDGTHLTAPGAAYVNSTLAAVMDLDDGHRAAVGHPGAGVIPAVMAIGDTRPVSNDRMIRAIVIGYEVAIRVAASRHLSQLTTMVSGPWIGQGVAAAAAYLRGLPADRMAQAIAIAGSTAPNLLAVGYSKVMGNHLKEGIPWATATGLSAVELAASGFTGPIDIFDNPELFRQDALLNGLGENWTMREIYFKPYSCCRWGHAAIDAALQLQAEHSLTPSDIKHITVDTFGWALRLNNEKHPRTLESAQYSVPFCVALALTAGADAFLPMSEKALSDAAATELSEKVNLVKDERFDAMFPQSVPARVSIETATRKLSREVLAPLGEPTNPMTSQQMRSKFRTVAQKKLMEKDVARMEDALDALRSRRLSTFRDQLNSPISVYRAGKRAAG